MFAASSENSALRSVILATAYADLAVAERHGERGVSAHKAYFSALQRLRNELNVPDFAATDGILGAVLALDAYEVCGVYLTKQSDSDSRSSCCLRVALIQ